jgi:hypothetical protein
VILKCFFCDHLPHVLEPSADGLKLVNRLPSRRHFPAMEVFEIAILEVASPIMDSRCSQNRTLQLSLIALRLWSELYRVCASQLLVALISAFEVQYGD